MNKIYLIEETWIDNMENRDCWGYDPVGFVETLKEAENIVSNGGRHKKGDCWGMNVEVKTGIIKEYPTRYRYKEIEKYKETIKNEN